MSTFYCVICNLKYEVIRLKDVHFLWDDEKYAGVPMCNLCYEVFKNDPHIKDSIDWYEKFRKYKKRKLIGLERWLYES